MIHKVQRRSRLERLLEMAEELSNSAALRPKNPELYLIRNDNRKKIDVLDVIIALYPEIKELENGRKESC